MSTQENEQNPETHIDKGESFLELQRNPIHEFREIGEIVRFEFKRIILTQKFFIALTFVLLPAIIYLDASAQEVAIILLDFGREDFITTSATGYIVLGQFLMQMVTIMLTLDSFGSDANDSMKRYFSLPIRKINIYIGHTITIAIGTAITGLFGILIFDVILWVWTGIGLTFVLIMQSFFLTLMGAFIAMAITTMFVIVANFFGFSSTIAIVPTLFLFYIIPFVFYFVAQFIYQVGEYQQWTFLYHLAVATDFMIYPRNGLQEILPWVSKITAWLVIGLTIVIAEMVSLIVFSLTDR
ncbi:MAG: hypothetical protein ACTSO7_10640 [Candidatus Heimdallarchaeota archaeon]